MHPPILVEAELLQAGETIPASGYRVNYLA
jgi:hypothetical protein